MACHSSFESTVRSARICLIVLTGVVLTACRTGGDAAALRAGASAYCELEPERCQERCAKCPDRERCFANGGECAAGAVGSLDDSGDAGADVFTPGCHRQYADGQCTQGGPAFFGVDECTERNSRLIWEWTLSTCHLPTGDIAEFDCEIECRRVGRGGGRCAWAEEVCYGRRSAYCKCDIPPPPNPTIGIVQRFP